MVRLVTRDVSTHQYGHHPGTASGGCQPIEIERVFRGIARGGGGVADVVEYLCDWEFGPLVKQGDARACRDGAAADHEGQCDRESALQGPSLKL